MLGFVWIQENQELFVTDAGLALLEGDPRPTVQRQISKLQIPRRGSTPFMAWTSLASCRTFFFCKLSTVATGVSRLTSMTCS